MIYASFCNNFLQNVLGSWGSAPDPAEGLTTIPRGGVWGRGGGVGVGVATSASAYSLGHRRKNTKKVENSW